MTNEQAQQILDDLILELGEHFDGDAPNIEIMVSWTNEGKTRGLCRGSGNWYARQALAQEFIARARAAEVALEIGDKLKDGPDEGDDWKVVG